MLTRLKTSLGMGTVARALPVPAAQPVGFARIEPKSLREHASLREYGFARKWTRCNCGCRSPRDPKDGTILARTTAAAPLWYKIALWAEDNWHHLTEDGACETARNDQVMIWDGDSQKLASAA